MAGVPKVARGISTPRIGRPGAAVRRHRHGQCFPWTTSRVRSLSWSTAATQTRRGRPKVSTGPSRQRRPLQPRTRSLQLGWRRLDHTKTPSPTLSQSCSTLRYRRRSTSGSSIRWRSARGRRLRLAKATCRWPRPRASSGRFSAGASYAACLRRTSLDVCRDQRA